MRNGISLQKRAEILAGNIRGVQEQAHHHTAAATTAAPLTAVVPRQVPLPDLVHPPTTRRLDDKGRVSVRIANRDLAELMGWSATVLGWERDGTWAVLRPVDAEARRNDGRARLRGSRLSLSVAIRRHLSVPQPGEVVVLALPESGAVALCHPSLLLAGAPLSLLEDSSDGSTAWEQAS